MNYIYHMLPLEMIGQVLHPLFVMKNINPDLYKKSIQKYDDNPDRKLLPMKRIEPLDCTRGDILQFSPLHPHFIKEAYLSVFPSARLKIQFYRIPIVRIAESPAVIYDLTKPEHEFGKDDPSSLFTPITSNTYRELSEVPPACIEFYQQWKDRRQKGAPLWGKIPHIFVKGSVDISGCDVITWA